MNLEGKVALVTGAGQGIGRAEALSLAEAGASVVVNDFSATPGKGAADEVAAKIVARGGSAIANYGDVANWDAAEAMIASAVSAFGGFDILVCNAGIVRDRMLFNMSEQEWDDVMRVHLKGHFAPLRFAGRYWREKAKREGRPSGGRAILTSSEAGMYGNPGQPNYSAAKAGIIGLCFDAAKELASAGVTVNVISPRGRTPMTEQAFGEFAEIPEGQFDEWDPANVAPFVTFLAGDGAANISGQVFTVYGDHVKRHQVWPVATEIRNGAIWTQSDLAGRIGDLVPDAAAGPPSMGDVDIPVAKS
ncbi:SDR family NAD(P)-dependent oxidoreductase [Pelagerythrobacter sp.]|uniref:SDR family NAD(P)-dependent oxidoreductase n=1 Tax=Pelagerythrobacter sp. TaxID=2800702 RepID=UPI0035AF3BFF